MRPVCDPRARELSTRERGMALIMVLWGCALLSVIATSFAFSIRAETTMAGNYLQRARAEAIADAGINRGIMALLMPDSESPWYPDGSVNERTFGVGKFRVAIVSENGKIDLNRAPEVLIYGLFSQLVETIPDFSDDHARQLAEAVIARRKPGQGARSRQAREEDSAPRADGKFLTVSELTRISGVTPEIMAALADSLTVYSRQGGIDAGTAPRQVLLAIPGLAPKRVDEFLASRVPPLQSDAGRNPRARSGVPVQLLASGSEFLSRARASVYTVDAEGTAPDGVRARRQAVIQLTGKPKRPYVTLAWRDALSRSKLTVGAPETRTGLANDVPAGG